MVSDDISVNVTSESRPTIWRLDWACRMCGTYGNVRVQVTGGPVKQRGGMYPKTSNEEVRTMVRLAHHKRTEGLCVNRTSRMLLGKVMWRYERDGVNTRIVALVNENGPPVTDYRWPPAMSPWVPR